LLFATKVDQFAVGLGDYRRNALYKMFNGKGNAFGRKIWKMV